MALGEVKTQPRKIHSGKEIPSWQKADQTQKECFPTELGVKLSQILVPICVTTCKDVHCRNQTHCDEIDNFARNILSCIESAAFETLPIVKQGQSKKEKNIHAGWSEEVKPFRDNAYFWSQIWKSAGKPQNCELHYQ